MIANHAIFKKISNRQKSVWGRISSFLMSALRLCWGWVRVQLDLSGWPTEEKQIEHLLSVKSQWIFISMWNVQLYTVENLFRNQESWLVKRRLGFSWNVVNFFRCSGCRCMWSTAVGLPWIFNDCIDDIVHFISYFNLLRFAANPLLSDSKPGWENDSESVVILHSALPGSSSEISSSSKITRKIV